MLRYLEEILQSGAWKGRRCFLFGGGPSLRNFNPKLLVDELTIGVNKAFMLFSPTLNYVMDIQLYNRLVSPAVTDKEDVRAKGMWQEYSGVKVILSLTPKNKVEEEVYVIRRFDEKTISFDINKGIYAGSNSGFGALMLAIVLGASPIYLLGYDFDVDKVNEKTHWHEGYKGQRLGKYVTQLVKFRKLFEDFAPYLETNDVKVVNLNAESKLKCFSFDTFENIVGIK